MGTFGCAWGRMFETAACLENRLEIIVLCGLLGAVNWFTNNIVQRFFLCSVSSRMPQKNF